MHRLFLFSPILGSTVASDNGGLINDISGGVGEISRAINDYGIAIVIMAVFFVIFLLLMVLILRNNAKMMDQLMKSQNSHNTIEQDVISKLVDNALEAKDNKEKSELSSMIDEVKNSIQSLENKVANNDSSNEQKEDYHKDLVGAYIDINMAFKDISRKTLNLLKCDRIAIYVFHNGNKSMLGLPFFKMSCIHEWTTHGTNTLRGKSHIDMPLHLFNDFIEDLWNNGVYKSDSIEKSAQIDHSINEFVAFSNTKSLYMIAIKTEYDAMSGFVVAEFSEEDKFEQDEARDKEVRSIIDDMIIKVTPIVSNKYIYRGRSGNE